MTKAPSIIEGAFTIFIVISLMQKSLHYLGGGRKASTANLRK